MSQGYEGQTTGTPQMVKQNGARDGSGWSKDLGASVQRVKTHMQFKGALDEEKRELTSLNGVESM